MYRFCFYEEAFNASTGEPKSVTGRYLFSFGIDRSKVFLAESIHKIALATPGISANDVFHKILEDVVSKKTNRFGVTDEIGNELVILLEFVRVIGDYPDVSECLHVLEHTVYVPCE